MSRPKGSSMSVISAQTRLPAALPMRTISSARRRESSSVGISAPEPVFTSSRIASQPAAIFLDRMLEAISGMLSTVAVTSRRA